MKMCHDFIRLDSYVNPNEDFVLVLVATVSAVGVRRELPTTTANYAVVVATVPGYQGREPLAS